MTNKGEANESSATTLCKSCGLCCTGHLFVWTKLRSAELDAVQDLGLKVFREPGQRGFSQPCPLWEGQCTIYDSPEYPRFCSTYKCKLLKEVIDEITPLPNALEVVKHLKERIAELDPLLPDLAGVSFRERLVVRLAELEKSARQGSIEMEFLGKAKELLTLYETQFGVGDLIDNLEEL